DVRFTPKSRHWLSAWASDTGTRHATQRRNACRVFYLVPPGPTPVHRCTFTAGYRGVSARFRRLLRRSVPRGLEPSIQTSAPISFSLSDCDPDQVKDWSGPRRQGKRRILRCRIVLFHSLAARTAQASADVCLDGA